jgi:hypothetical protein
MREEPDRHRDETGTALRSLAPINLTTLDYRAP